MSVLRDQPIRRGLSLATKLTIYFAGGAALIVGVVGWWSARSYRRSLQEMVVSSAERNVDLIRRSTRHAMQQNSREDLYFIIRSIGELPGMGRVRIFNKEGRITFSTDAAEAGTILDKNAEACYGCHARAAPLERLDRPDRVRYFQHNGTPMLGLIAPITNEPQCSNAACHAHPVSQRVLGVLDVNMPLAGVEATMATFERRSLLLDAIGVLAIVAFTPLVAYRLIHRPVKALNAGTRRVAAGDLEQRIPWNDSGDELAALAASFNEMTAQLAAARQESLEWARTLEVRVEEKASELERAHRQLVAVEKMASLGKLSAAVAHEINNPLAGILTYARWLQRTMGAAAGNGGRSGEWKQALEVIESESRRCGEIVKNLLTFARQTPLEAAECDMNTVVERCLRLVRHQAEMQNVELEWQPAPRLPAVVCDASQMQQALLAILINSVEALPRGGRVLIHAEPRAEELRITIADTGPGIPGDVLPHIFEPFFTTKTHGKGTGLGLSLAHGIISQHGGRIEVDSGAGRGASFCVVLPTQGVTPCPKLNAAISSS